jgi:tetratricopeptide (TPR) repeat protein
VFSALTFEALFRLIKSQAGKYILYGIISVGILLPAIFIVRNFPVIYVYFNEFAGGVDGTYGDYQLDYYACSAKPVADWMVKNIPYDSTLRIVSNNPWELDVVWKSDKSKFTAGYIRYRERNEHDWDYAVFLPQFVDPYMMKKGYFPPKGTIYKFMVDHSVVACVVKRQSKDDYEGIEDLKKQQIGPALELLQKAVQIDPTNEIALTYLGVAYASVGQFDQANKALMAAMNISPEYQLPRMYYDRINQRQ